MCKIVLNDSFWPNGVQYQMWNGKEKSEKKDYERVLIGRLVWTSESLNGTGTGNESNAESASLTLNSEKYHSSVTCNHQMNKHLSVIS